MGTVCCCLRDVNCDDYLSANSSYYRNCMCLGCFVHNLFTLYSSLFRRGEVHAIPSAIQTASSETSIPSGDNSLSDLYRAPPRPLPYDTDPRYFRLQRGLVSRREKGSSHLHEESEPLRNDIDSDVDNSVAAEKWKESRNEVSKEYRTRSSFRLTSAKYKPGIALVYSSSEDEDVCPTCLEEYTTENPKIMTTCSHHFHLACIYEWMERSDSCPVCGKVMEFEET